MTRFQKATGGATLSVWAIVFLKILFFGGDIELVRLASAPFLIFCGYLFGDAILRRKAGRNSD